jgi:hypothetical protein
VYGGGSFFQGVWEETSRERRARAMVLERWKVQGNRALGGLWVSLNTIGKTRGKTRCSRMRGRTRIRRRGKPRMAAVREINFFVIQRSGGAIADREEQARF